MKWVATSSQHDHVTLTAIGRGLYLVGVTSRSGSYTRSGAMLREHVDAWLRAEGVVLTSPWAEEKEGAR